MPARPEVIPEGYLPYTCWSRNVDCILWVAPHPETDAPPVEWSQPCAEGSPGGDGCRQLVQNWGEGRSSDIGVGTFTRPEIDTLASPPLLRLARLTSDSDPDRRYVEWVVTELDGPMRWAMRELTPTVHPTCGYREGDLNEGVWTFTAVGDGVEELGVSGPSAALVIDLEADRIDLVHPDDGVPPTWFGGRDLLVSSWLNLEGYRRPGDEQFTLYDADFDPIAGSPTPAFHLVGDRAVFEVAHNGLGVRVYDPDRGQHELVPIGDDPSRGTAAPGTDGIDLVWMEGSGRAPGDLRYPIRDIMTAPFTTDPEALQPRRLRSDVYEHDLGAGDESWVVGCGRAARAGPGTKDVQLVRLEDGFAWYLPQDELVWQAISVAGITCDEIFLTVQLWTGGEPQGTTVQRVRLDGLGAGVPPD